MLILQLREQVCSFYVSPIFELFVQSLEWIKGLCLLLLRQICQIKTFDVVINYQTRLLQNMLTFWQIKLWSSDPAKALLLGQTKIQNVDILFHSHWWLRIDSAFQKAVCISYIKAWASSQSSYQSKSVNASWHCDWPHRSWPFSFHEYSSYARSRDFFNSITVPTSLVSKMNTNDLFAWLLDVKRKEFCLIFPVHTAMWKSLSQNMSYFYWTPITSAKQIASAPSLTSILGWL